MTAFRSGLLCLLLFMLAACTATPPRAVGDWNGIITTPTGELTLIAHIRSVSSDGANTIESPEQAPGEQIPIRIIAATDDALAFDVPSLKATFRSKWNAQTNQWSGEWQQSGYRLPLNLSAGPGNAVVKGLDGTWAAKVVRATGAFRLILRIETAGTGTLIKFDAPDAGASNLAVSPFQRMGSRITFGVPATGAHFDGTLTPDEKAMAGTWSFPQQPPTRVTFTRLTNAPHDTGTGDASKPAHSAQYATSILKIGNAAAPGVTLACTMTRPNRPPPYPTIVFATGSGAQDRDETMFGHKFFAVIADDLASKGFASLRCDDRGIALSTGSFTAATTLDFASDAAAQVTFLLDQRDVRPDAIYLLGHSEGALVSVIATGTNQHVAGLVLLGAPGTNLRQVLLVQRRLIGQAQGQPLEWLVQTQPIIERIFDALATSGSQADAETRVRAILTPEARTSLRLTAASAELFIQQMASPWMRMFLRLDVRSYLAKVRVPVLALAGSLDRQVEPVTNLDALRAGLSQSPETTIRLLEGLNHFMQKAQTGAPSEYAGIPETINAVALMEISSWLQSHVRVAMGSRQPPPDTDSGSDAISKQ